MTGSDRLIVALDATTLARAVAVARQLRGLVRTLKIGGALFIACGPSAIQRVRALGFSVMLDLKFFDIPSTVELSCRAAVRHRVAMLTVHAAGGRAMLEAAVRGVHDEAKRMKLAPQHRPQVLAITVLTSEPVPPTTGGGGSEARGGQRELRKRVLTLAEMALNAGCDGVVASAQEAGEFRRAFRRVPLKIICPGIRPAWALRKDQRRIATPTQALAAGADALVVGRPITASPDPRVAAQRILKDMKDINAC